MMINVSDCDQGVEDDQDNKGRLQKKNGITWELFPRNTVFFLKTSLGQVGRSEIKRCVSESVSE